MSRCDVCIIERPDTAAMPLEAFHEELLACSDCPLLAASPSVRLLVQKHGEAARSMRIRGEVARTLVDLDFDPESVTTLSSVEEALRHCLSEPPG